MTLPLLRKLLDHTCAVSAHHDQQRHEEHQRPSRQQIEFDAQSEDGES